MTQVPKKRGRPPKARVTDHMAGARKAVVANIKEQIARGDDNVMVAELVGDVSEARVVTTVTVQKLTDHELTGLIAEALYAHEMQARAVRFDTLGRKWTFEPGRRGDNLTLSFSVLRGADVFTRDLISSALGVDKPLEAIAPIVRELDQCA